MLVIVFVIYYIFVSIEALRWTKTGYAVNTNTVISILNVESSPEIDVSFGTQVTIIRDTTTFDRGIKIYCYIAGYHKDKPIQFSFCKDAGDCYDIADGINLKSLNQFNFDIEFNTSIPNKKGIEIIVKIPKENFDYSGGYFCKAKNNNFEIRSNNIDIRDKIYWIGNLFNDIVTDKKTNIKIINQDSLPQVLNCSDGASTLNPAAPKWTKVEFVSPVEWYVCPVFDLKYAEKSISKMTFSDCLKYVKEKPDNSLDPEIHPIDLSFMDSWSTYINQNGDLIFTELRPQTNARVTSYSLICYSKYKNEGNKALFYFLDTFNNNVIENGIVFDGTTVATSQPLKMISSAVQEFILYARQNPTDNQGLTIKPVAIYAFYKSSPEAIYKWKHMNVELNSNNILKISKYMITFSGDITWKQAGKYILQVTFKTEEIKFEINVKVLGAPILMDNNCLTPLLYVWQGGSASFKCTYRQRPTDMKIQINGQDLKLTDSLENSKANLKKSNPYLEILNFSLSSVSEMDNDLISISYQVSNLTKSLGHLQYQDHTVTFLASNDFGISVKTSSIYVVPIVKNMVKYFPELDNCTDPCSSLIIHKFKCEVNLEEYANKELIVEQYWTINSNRLDDKHTNNRHLFTSYFKVDPVTKVLTMLPIKSNDTANDDQVKKALKNNFIVCNIDINPASSGETDFIYRSSLDHELSGSMKAKITLDYTPINTAYIYWIVAIILGLIVLIILIVLLTRYCMKNKGESYPLDKLEREHGYDPDKEVQEEMFKPYERQEHDPEALLSNGEERRMSVTGNSVGSYDDGELDNYDLDPSNFNEDGSIIGKYGANPRSRAVIS